MTGRSERQEWVRYIGLVVAVAMMAVFQPWVTRVQASAPSHPAYTPALSPADYPSGTKLQYFPHWTNAQFDCNFGWFCEYGTPFTHLQHEDALHRVSGWALWGEWHNDAMGFELYSSVYSADAAPNGGTWNQQAAADEEQALLLQHAHRVNGLTQLVRAGVTGGMLAMQLTRIGMHMLFVTVWWGNSHEVEAAALYPARRRGEARRYLISQVQAAVRLASQSAPR